MIAPSDCEILLEDKTVLARFDEDEYIPYWATIWPAAFALAEEVARWPAVGPDERPPHILELGCGLGLAGIVATARGYRVIETDYDEDAVAFAVENARRNGLTFRAARVIDWRERYDDLRPDRIIAADVLYEKRNLKPIAEFLRAHLRPGGAAIITDANRSTADGFAETARDSGFEVRVRDCGEVCGIDGITAGARLFECKVW
jgi:predicted nicotinamide N-methyase